MTDWGTPKVLFDPLNELLQFKVDAAADSSNHLLPEWYGPGSLLGEDALDVPIWLSPAWCNPPYGRGIERWLKKFIEQKELGNRVVALVPARTEVRWWYDYVVPEANIIFLVGRVPFVDPARTKPTQPDHGSALLTYEPGSGQNITWIDWKARFGNGSSMVEPVERDTQAPRVDVSVPAGA